MTPFWTFLFWSSLAGLGYVLVGYAASLLLLSWFVRRKPVGECCPSVSLLIPAHNEERVLRAKLENALSLDYPRDRLEIIVASDGSADETVAIARQFEDRGVSVLGFVDRRGKASVLNDAAGRCRGEVMCLCDANVMFRPNALRILVSHLAVPSVGAVTGEVRLASEESNFGQGESAYYCLERRLQAAESQVGSLMGVDGGMYVVRRKLFRPLPADTILDDFVISMQVIRQGFRVVYDPAALAVENGAPRASQEWRRRVRVSAGAAQSIRRGAWPPLRRPVELWQYLSHKLFRWTTPALLACLMVSSVVLFPTALVYQLASYLQAAVYGTALMATGSLRMRQTRLGGVTFYFVMSNVAMAVGFFKGVFNLQPVTWALAERKHLHEIPESSVSTQ